MTPIGCSSRLARYAALLLISFALLACQLFQPNQKDLTEESAVAVATPVAAATAVADVTAALSPVPTRPLPTMMSMGASYQTFEGVFNGAAYSIDYPYCFAPRDSGPVGEVCLDAPERLCVVIQPYDGEWGSVQAFEDEVVLAFSSAVSNYQEIQRRVTISADGYPAVLVGYTYTTQGQEMEGLRLFVLANPVGFDVAGEGDRVMMEVYRGVIRHMLDSFHLEIP